MPLTFPTTPANGDTAVLNGKTYTYDSTKTVWTVAGSSGGGGGSSYGDTDVATYLFGNLDTHILPNTNDTYDIGSASNKIRDLYVSDNSLHIGAHTMSADADGIVMPAMTLGTGANKIKLSASATGELRQTRTVGGVQQEEAPAAPPANQVVPNMPALIALTGMSSGDQALVTALNKVFMYTGTAWFLIATMTNASPTAITGVEGTYALANDGTATTITAISSDPEGFALTWSYAVTTGSLGSTATVSQVDNVFTITPSSDAANAGSFSLTFSVTDGATGAVGAVSAFTLAFSMNHTLAYVLRSTSTNPTGWGVVANTDSYGHVGSNAADYTITADPWQNSSLGWSHGSVALYNNSDGSLRWTKSNPETIYDNAMGWTDYFGYCVAANNTYVAVGSPNSTAQANYVGKTFVYTVADGTLTYELYPTGIASHDNSRAWGGRIVCMDDNFLAVATSENVDIYRLDTGALVDTVTGCFTNLVTADSGWGVCRMYSGKLIIGDPYWPSSPDSIYSGGSSGYQQKAGRILVYSVTNSGASLIRETGSPVPTGDAAGGPGGVGVAAGTYEPYFGFAVAMSPDGTKYAAKVHWGSTSAVLSANGHQFGKRSVVVYNTSDGSVAQTIYNHRDGTFPTMAERHQNWGFAPSSIALSNTELYVGDTRFNHPDGAVLRYSIATGNFEAELGSFPSSTETYGYWGVGINVNSANNMVSVKGQENIQIFD
jgi:hypothetical protein